MIDKKTLRSLTQKAATEPDPVAWMAAADLLEEAGDEGNPWAERAIVWRRRAEWFDEVEEAIVAVAYHRRNIAEVKREKYWIGIESDLDRIRLRVWVWAHDHDNIWRSLYDSGRAVDPWIVRNHPYSEYLVKKALEFIDRIIVDEAGY